MDKRSKILTGIKTQINFKNLMIREKAGLNRPHTVFHLYKVPEKSKLKAESKLVVAWSWGRNRESLHISYNWPVVMLA